MAPSHRQGGDRLSALPDTALERVLSHLESDEAVRTSGLARRWRRVHEGVPVVHLVDTKTGERNRGFGELKVCYDHQVTSAIMGKGSGTPIRVLRLDAFYPPYDLLDQWIVTAVNSGVEDLDVELRYRESGLGGRLCPFTPDLYGRKNSADFDKSDRNRYTHTQRHIFGCPTLRRLRLVGWRLDMPENLAMTMASLETLCLARIMDPRGELQRLIWSCPRLASLTLEQCPSIIEITVASPCLRSFAMICCHHATGVDLQTTCLESLHYKGGLPPRGSSFITVANYDGVKAVRIEICEKLSSKAPDDIAPVTTLIRSCKKNLKYLHLSLRPSMAYYSSLFTSLLRSLDSLTHLSLQGCLPTEDAVRSVSALLVDAKNLKVLSLFPLGPEPPKNKSMRMYRDQDDDKSDSDSEPEEGPAVSDGVQYRMPKTLWKVQVRCLAYKMRRINIGNYKGRPLEKMLARFLLSRAAALEEFSVTLAAEVHPQKDEITKELLSWRQNRRTRVICK
ncbi:hypothetical protein CFC21_032000 [Triticum aestivum]|uniref:F-box domain-containing protein n=2 Tax=Triticum aestivum TaxID=4565 RepID=A0A3B6DNX6_WHEAT|nr:putative F-box/FBD/LRR-repeat protein At5g22670 [Aegilops tauschii subsp. strangulata]KAF7018746.1 hypothetical protein CFC21_032000 [Triticum aestivum]